MLTLFRERYEVIATVGSGGEAQIVKALDRQHGRFVALKIRPVRDEAAREDLLGEARVLLALPPHPALPLVREDFFDRDDYVVAMDWVEGTDLATLLAENGRSRRRACWPTSPRRPRRSRTCTRSRRRSSTETSSPGTVS